MTAVKRIAIALAVILAMLLFYGVAIEPRLILDERRYDAQIPHLPAGWHGETVAVIADLQVGMWLDNTGMAEKAVDRIVAERPAAALLAGDFLYDTGPDPGSEIETVIEVLAPLTAAGIPTFAVLGNHDYRVGAALELTRALEAHGIEVLLNEATIIPPRRSGERPMYVVGIGPARPGLADVDKALRGVPPEAARVVLMHNPIVFDELPPGAAPLAVAGHTHCGQIALPGTPRWSYLALTAEEALVADGFPPAGYGAPGNRLFVTCGIGFSLIPVRINAPPQVVFFELLPGSGADPVGADASAWRVAGPGRRSAAANATAR